KVINLRNNDTQKVNNGSQLFVKDSHRLVKIDMKKIQMVEALADYVNIYTAEKRYTVLSTLKGILEKLPQNDFMRVHKSYIIRLDAIGQIEDNTISIDKKLIPVSNTYKKQLMERLKII